MLTEIDPTGGMDDRGGPARSVEAVLEVRRRVMARAAVEARLMQHDADRVTVRGRIHLLPLGVERELREQQAELDDRLAVLRHCDPRLDPRCADLYEHAGRMRERTANQLDAFVVDVEVSVGRPPIDGADWSTIGLPLATIDSVEDEFAAMRQALVTEVRRLADSELVRIIPHAELWSGARAVDTGTVELGLTSFEPTSVERVRAFVASTARVVDEAEQAVMWLRLASLTTGQPDARATVVDIEARRLQALDDLDVLRAMQAAIAELEAPHG